MEQTPRRGKIMGWQDCRAVVLGPGWWNVRRADTKGPGGVYAVPDGEMGRAKADGGPSSETDAMVCE